MRPGLIDAATRGRLVERFGVRAIDWCERLPAKVDDLARKWSLRIVGSVSRSRNSCVLLCERNDGAAAVLKLTPDRSLGLGEAAALAAWRDSGKVPRVFEFDGESGTLLMEEIRPGTMLADDPSETGLNEIARLVRALHDSPGDEAVTEFPPLIERVEFIFTFLGGLLEKPEVASVVSTDLVEESLVKARELAGRPGRRVLLHGDLHPHNVLDGGKDRGPIAIDPRACVGDPAFDLIDWVFAEGGGESTLTRRAGWLAQEAGTDPDSLIDWCRSTAVLVSIARLSRGGNSGDVRSLLEFAVDGS